LAHCNIPKRIWLMSKHFNWRFVNRRVTRWRKKSLRDHRK
jgi:hypothetical protein